MNSRVDGVALHERRDRPVAPGPAPQRRHEVRVRQAPHVEHQVGVDRHAVLEAEAEEGDDEAGARADPRDSPMKNCRSSWTVMSDVSTISSAMLADGVIMRAARRGSPRSPTDPAPADAAAASR